MTLIAGNLDGKLVIKVNTVEFKVYDKTCNQYFYEQADIPELEITDYIEERFNNTASSSCEELVNYSILSFYYKTLCATKNYGKTLNKYVASLRGPETDEQD